jgi:endonuclease/exonuclease/phosphatase family metal-dependent hydrolase
MKACFFKSLFFVLAVSLIGCDAEKEYIQVVTFNIRLDTPADGINRWEARIPVVKSYFERMAPDIVGMQEVLHRQLLDFQEILPDYSFIGTGRDDGIERGEYSPIFFRNDVFNLIDHSQFWLSETPEIPGSKSWDAAITRIVTWAKLEHISSGKEIYFFNTHFDHRGVLARQMSTDLMSEKMAEIAGGSPLVATGDFNIRKRSSSLGGAMYYNLICGFKENNALTNTEYASMSPVSSGGATSNGFNPNWRERPPYAIDYIFSNDHFMVESYRVDHVMEGDVFISDHWPVVAYLSFTK